MNIAASRILRRARLTPTSTYICPQCQRGLAATATVASGHSRWSKIKHDKGTNDMAKNRQRAQFSQELMLASKMSGADPQFNPRLATVIATAKKAGVPKAAMEASIARGQGMSTSGAKLESLSIEMMIPPAVAVIVDMQTDNKNRTMQQIRMKMKKHNGTATPTSYMFTKRGRIVLEKDDRGLGAEDVLDEAVEAGAEDVEVDGHGNIVVSIEPNQTTAAATRLEEALRMKIQSADIIWTPNPETVVELDSEESVKAIADLVDDLEDDPEVQGVYLNVAPESLDASKSRIEE